MLAADGMLFAFVRTTNAGAGRGVAVAKFNLLAGELMGVSPRSSQTSAAMGLALVVGTTWVS
jgi:hypothetical protein